MEKAAPKTANIRKNKDDFKICQKWPLCNGYSLCKMLSLDQKLKLPKTCQNDSRSTLELFYAKNGTPKQLIIDKRDDFKICQKCPLWKGYSLCKMLSLDQRLKLPKTRKKTTSPARYSSYMQNTVQRKSSYSKNETILKFSKNGRYAKAKPSAKCSVWIKT